MKHLDNRLGNCRGRLSLGSASTTTGYSRENVSQPPAAYRILYAETALGGGLGAPPPFVKAAPRRSKSSASQSALPFFRRPSARPTPTPAPPSQAPPQRCKVPLLRFGSGVGGGDTRRRSRASEASRRLSTCQPNMAALEAGIAVSFILTLKQGTNMNILKNRSYLTILIKYGVSTSLSFKISRYST